MKLEQLEQYNDLRREVELLEARLRRAEKSAARMVTDSVKASSEYFPYLEYTQKITGTDARRSARLKHIAELYKRRKEGLHRQLEEIQQWIATVPDSKVRQIIELRYIEGRTWNATARRVYGYPCGDAARMRVKRLF